VNTFPKPTVVIDSDRDDWFRRARCNSPDRDMWTSDDAQVRLAAAHQCRTHCPVLESCERAARGQDWRSTTVAGVAYGQSGNEVGVVPPSLCGECAPGMLVGADRRRQQWRESAARRRAVKLR
jgi:hypothetical protein